MFRLWIYDTFWLFLIETVFFTLTVFDSVSPILRTQYSITMISQIRLSKLVSNSEFRTIVLMAWHSNQTARRNTCLNFFYVAFNLNSIVAFLLFWKQFSITFDSSSNSTLTRKYVGQRPQRIVYASWNIFFTQSYSFTQSYRR